MRSRQKSFALIAVVVGLGGIAVGGLSGLAGGGAVGCGADDAAVEESASSDVRGNIGHSSQATSASVSASIPLKCPGQTMFGDPRWFSETGQDQSLAEIFAKGSAEAACKDANAALDSALSIPNVCGCTKKKAGKKCEATAQRCYAQRIGCQRLKAPRRTVTGSYDHYSCTYRVSGAWIECSKQMPEAACVMPPFTGAATFPLPCFKCTYYAAEAEWDWLMGWSQTPQPTPKSYNAPTAAAARALCEAEFGAGHCKKCDPC
jgi:hypothetical protein